LLAELALRSQEIVSNDINTLQGAATSLTEQLAELRRELQEQRREQEAQRQEFKALADVREKEKEVLRSVTSELLTLKAGLQHEKQQQEPFEVEMQTKLSEDESRQEEELKAQQTIQLELKHGVALQQRLSSIPNAVKAKLELERQQGQDQLEALVKAEIDKAATSLMASQQQMIVAKVQSEVTHIGQQMMDKKMAGISRTVQTMLQSSVRRPKDSERLLEQQLEVLVKAEMENAAPSLTESQQQTIVAKVQSEVTQVQKQVIDKKIAGISRTVQTKLEQRKGSFDPRDTFEMPAHQQFEALVKAEMEKAAPSLTEAQQQMIVAKVQSEVTQVQKQVIDKKMAGISRTVQTKLEQRKGVSFGTRDTFEMPAHQQFEALVKAEPLPRSRKPSSK
jgi:hypothetical protein